MAIVVQCSCGRTLRAPQQMAGKLATCLCGNRVTLPQAMTSTDNELLEAELADPDSDSDQAPILLSRSSDRKLPNKNNATGGRDSIFRPSQGRNVERGESEQDEAKSLRPIQARQKRKKRRQDKQNATDRKRQGRETFLSGINRSLKFPLRTESMLTILVMAFGYGAFTSSMAFIPYGVFGFRAFAVLFLGTTLILGYFLHFLFQLFRLAVVDEDDLPLTMEFDTDLIRQDIWLWLGTLWWCCLPMMGYWWVSARLIRWGILTPGAWMGWGFGVAGCLCLFMLPMALMSAALHLSVFAANPWTILRTIARVPGEYILICGLFGTLVITMLLVGRSLPPFPPVVPILSQFATWIMVFFALTSASYGLGNFYYRNRIKIGWFGDSSQPQKW